ncbi:TniQ family protein [Bradyrhizobium sp. Ash2021]|uniref:TniQ family protein n=1 Tax=Bradyrhizobium sp. Ash2021 TaxID=2954771 RepID=UPI002816010B|nr:TniQ family protein [Bradyrhizobium sp. Ash2021]WMT73542.1 TniQ family protein [Bradyrhizobium sp. Ash2021]
MTGEVGIYRTTIDGMEVTSFLDPPAPAPDESLVGWVARAAEDHAFRSISRALEKVGVLKCSPETLPLLGHQICDQISFLLKAPRAEVEARIYGAVHQTSGRNRQIEFFGSKIRKTYRQSKIRRVAPRALVASAHHRAIWDIRIFGFCADTKEVLLETCPVCRKKLGWRRTHGIEYCDSCKDEQGERATDLRDFPQPIVATQDEAGLSIMCDLIHPLSERREKARRSISAPLVEYSNDDIFEFGIALCCAETMKPTRTQKTLERPKCLEDYARFTPEILAHAGRAILDWPSGLHSITDSIRAKAEQRKAFYGIGKELGPLAAVRRLNTLPLGIGNLVQDAIDRDMLETAASSPTPRRADYRTRELITCRKASQKYHCERALLGRLAREGILKSIRADGCRLAPLLLYDAEIADLVERASEAERSIKAATRLGIPIGAMPDLARRGMITEVKGPEIRLLGSNDCYKTKSIDDLIASIEAAANCGTPPETHVTITKAVNRIGFPGPKPWGDVFQAILDRKLQIWRIEERITAATKRNAVEHIDQVYELVAPARLHLHSEQQGFVTYREAADIIGTCEVAIAHLVRANQLAATDQSRLKLERSDVIRFIKEKMLTSELSKRLGITYGQVPRYMASLGIEPILRAPADGNFVWSRQLVEAALSGSKNLAATTK